MTRYTMVVTMKNGSPYTDSGLTEEELKVRLSAFFGDSSSTIIHITKYEV